MYVAMRVCLYVTACGREAQRVGEKHSVWARLIQSQTERVCMRDRERGRESARAREGEREGERVCVFVCVCERERAYLHACLMQMAYCMPNMDV